MNETRELTVGQRERAAKETGRCPECENLLEEMNYSRSTSEDGSALDREVKRWTTK